VDNDAVEDLVADAARRRTAVMCSESVWWRCHRRLIGDHLELVRSVDVVHLLPGGRTAAHAPTDGVRRRDDGALVYDGGAEPLS
jgi:uncharacterized protein (DUF488 family)